MGLLRLLLFFRKMVCIPVSGIIGFCIFKESAIIDYACMANLKRAQDSVKSRACCFFVGRRALKV